MIQFASHVAPASSAASVPKLAAIERTNHLVQEGRPAHDGLTPHCISKVILRLGPSTSARQSGVGVGAGAESPLLKPANPLSRPETETP